MDAKDLESIPETKHERVKNGIELYTLKELAERDSVHYNTALHRAKVWIYKAVYLRYWAKFIIRYLDIYYSEKLANEKRRGKNINICNW